MTMLAVYLAGGAASFAALVACDRVTGWRAPEEPPAPLRLIAVLAVLWPVVLLNLALCLTRELVGCGQRDELSD